MLKNCFLPVNYNKPKSQTCGEIICENLHEFIINCKLCKIKIFEFEEFVQHFRNVHLDETSNKDNKNFKTLASNVEQEQERVDNYERIIKLEITEANDGNKEEEIKNENEEFVWNVENLDNYTDEDNDYEANTDDDDEDYEGEEEEQSKSIMKKVDSFKFLKYLNVY